MYKFIYNVWECMFECIRIYIIYSSTYIFHVLYYILKLSSINIIHAVKDVIRLQVYVL